MTAHPGPHLKDVKGCPYIAVLRARVTPISRCPFTSFSRRGDRGAGDARPGGRTRPDRRGRACRDRRRAALPAPGTSARARLDTLHRAGVAGYLAVARRRPPSWADQDTLPSAGCRCSCCGGQAWWCERQNPQGWRRSTLPPGATVLAGWCGARGADVIRRTPTGEARELRRRAEELRMRAERFGIEGLPLFTEAGRRRCAELHAQADRVDPPPMFRSADASRLLPSRSPWRSRRSRPSCWVATASAVTESRCGTAHRSSPSPAGCSLSLSIRGATRVALGQHRDRQHGRAAGRTGAARRDRARQWAARGCRLPAQKGVSLTPVPGRNGAGAGAGGMTLAGTRSPLVA